MTAQPFYVDNMPPVEATDLPFLIAMYLMNPHGYGCAGNVKNYDFGEPYNLSKTHVISTLFIPIGSYTNIYDYYEFYLTNATYSNIYGSTIRPLVVVNPSWTTFEQVSVGLAALQPYGVTKTILLPPNTSFNILPNGEDFTSCVSVLFPDTDGVNANGAGIYTFDSTEYVTDVLTVSNGVSTCSYPVKRNPEKLLGYANPPLSGTYGLDTPAGFGDRSSWTPAAVTISNRTISCDLPQKWRAFLSKRKRYAAQNPDWQHINEQAEDEEGDALPCGYTYNWIDQRTLGTIGVTQLLYPTYNDAMTAGSYSARSNANGSTSSLAIINPDAIELPAPVSGVVTVPECYSGAWWVEIVDEYYCMMKEYSATF
jgi:hypothetical protein